ncbi:MAG: DUF364 domain-containing protein [Proteobacteria bacterium]|nr:DUF364 domain-containing protein [Pseudomonadota bacterium]
MKIAENLIERGRPLSRGRTITDVRLGLDYTIVEISDGSAGLAWTPDKKQSGSCTHLRLAGCLLGMEAAELLTWLASEKFLERAIGLVTFNALNSTVDRELLEEESISLLKLQNTDHVVMVGYFAPLIPKIKATSCQLTVIELDGEKPGVIGVGPGMTALAACDVAIITSTSIINNTIDGLLAVLSGHRAAVMIGPSTPVCPEVFAGTGISQLSGAYVFDVDKAKIIVSQGGGTMLLKKTLRFASVQVT